MSTIYALHVFLAPFLYLTANFIYSKCIVIVCIPMNNKKDSSIIFIQQ